MSFSSAEKAKVRMYLGYPQVFTYQNTRLEMAFAAMAENNPDGVALVQDMLAKLDVLDGYFSDQSEAGIQQVDEIKFFGGSAATSARDRALRSEGRRLVGRLSILFDVPINGDAFGAGGMVSDWWFDDGSSGFWVV